MKSAPRCRSTTKVVDLWGGLADQATGQAWEEDTVALVFSTTKGMTAACAHILADRGELDFEAPVTDYWPEFAAEGKGEVPVKWLFCHKTGLVDIDGTMSLLPYGERLPIGQLD